MITREAAARRREQRGTNPHPKGSGHGEVTYLPAKRTNVMVSEEARIARSVVLAARDERVREYVASLPKLREAREMRAAERKARKAAA